MATSPKLRVLLAEDNLVNQKVAIRMLSRIGYEADVVVNGQEAVDALSRTPYDVIFMDMQMPVMDGLEATRVIRDTVSSERQPHIIALTANAMRGDKERCMAAGMNDYISKPVQMDILANALASVHPLSSSASTSPHDEEHQAVMAGIRTQLLELAGEDDDEFVREILSDYLEVAPELLRKIQAAIQEHDVTQARNAAHTLKSSSGAIGAAELQELCNNLEQLAYTGTLDGAVALTTDINEAFERLERILQKEVEAA
ncbi:MAG: response regulator [Bacteroidota bacterium]